MSVICGDSLHVLPTLDAESVDAIVCDPPYGLSFMGKDWDHGVPGEAFWREAWRVAKPGAHLVAFGGTRTYHRLACAIEDAGWEIRDCLSWLYGSGFPKSLDVSKQIDKHGGTPPAWFGPWFRAWRESQGITQKQVAALFPSKTGNLTGCVANWELGFNLPTPEQFNLIRDTFGLPFDSIEAAEREVVGRERGTLLAVAPGQENDRSATTLDITAPATDLAKQWHGWGTALKPAWEPIILARKPLVGTVAANVTQCGTGALNVDGCRIGFASDADEAESKGKNQHTRYANPASNRDSYSGNMPPRTDYDASGRWPANVCLDERQEDVLYLRDSVPAEIAHLISEFYSGYNRVPPMREESSGVPEQGGSLEVLQSSVLGAVDVGERAGGFAPDEGAQALGGIFGKNAHEDAGDGKARTEQPELEGWSVREFERVRSGDGAEQPQGKTGTPNRDGGRVGEATRPEGGRASSERHQTRQQARELGADGQPDTQAGTQRHRAGASRIEGGERTLAVLACDVPAGWHQYFRVGGSVRSPDCAAGMLDAQSGPAGSNSTTPGSGSGKGFLAGIGSKVAHDTRASGGASRFFYTAKASRREREAGCEVNGHPTVKPIALMRWLCRLVTPKGGLILDPFTGSGTTGCAAVLEGFRFVGVEREPEYAAIAEKRIAHWAAQTPDADLFTEAR